MSTSNINTETVTITTTEIKKGKADTRDWPVQTMIFPHLAYFAMTETDSNLRKNNYFHPAPGTIIKRASGELYRVIGVDYTERPKYPILRAVAFNM